MFTHYARVASAAALLSISATANAASAANTSFNPAISLILNGTLSNFSKNPTTYALPGFALGEETGPGDEGLRLGESELVISSNIDDKFYGSLAAALTPENKVEIEEAFIETLSLGSGATIKAGRFLSHVGYLNNIHAHAWDFVDQPLVYRAMFGNQLNDDGIQLRWVAPTDLLVELGIEVFRGDDFPAGGGANSGKGTKTAFAHIGGDVGSSHAWRVGLSKITADANDRTTGDETAPDLFSGRGKLTGIDFIWKWMPNGNATAQNAKFQFEYWKRDEDGTFDPASTGAPFNYQGAQKGWYAQTVYQFMPRWRAGLRYDKLESDNVDAMLAGTVLDNAGHQPSRTSLMVDFSNSEFSRLRIQFNQDESRADQKDRQWYLQYIMSLGSHGAHSF